MNDKVVVSMNTTLKSEGYT